MLFRLFTNLCIYFKTTILNVYQFTGTWTVKNDNMKKLLGADLKNFLTICAWELADPHG